MGERPDSYGSPWAIATSFTSWPGFWRRVSGMCTLVVNLTRFGDLLQTQPVLSGL